MQARVVAYRSFAVTRCVRMHDAGFAGTGLGQRHTKEGGWFALADAD